MFDIDKYLQTSNLKHNSKGRMMFADDLYLTHWRMSQDSLKSNTLFTVLDKESFELNDAVFDQSLSWHEFGIVQSIGESDQGDFSSPLHQNMHLELYYVDEGSFKLRIQGETLELKAGQAILINQNTLHSDVMNNMGANVYIFGLNKSLFKETSFTEPLQSFIENCFNPNLDYSEYWVIKDIKDKDKVHSIIQSIQSELETKDVGYQEIQKGYLVRLMEHIINDSVIEIQKDTRGNLRDILFDEVSRYMKRHYAKVSLKDLSSVMKFSPDYFSRLIKDMSGYTYIQYLQKIRVDVAKKFLLETEDAISDISKSVGYQNTSHFYEIFKSSTGQTPHEYRQNRK